MRGFGLNHCNIPPDLVESLTSYCIFLPIHDVPVTPLTTAHDYIPPPFHRRVIHISVGILLLALITAMLAPSYMYVQ